MIINPRLYVLEEACIVGMYASNQTSEALIRSSLKEKSVCFILAMAFLSERGFSGNRGDVCV